MAWKASSRADHSWSFPEKNLPCRRLLTIGHRCSMGLRSGDIAGHRPAFNCRMLLLAMKALVAADRCTDAPSCWKVHPELLWYKEGGNAEHGAVMNTLA